MNKFDKFVKGPIFPLFGAVGALITGLGCIIAAIAYRGPEGQLYSILNYFISELGATNQSELAIAFNLGVFIGGSFMTVYMAGLFFYLTKKIGKLGSILGIGSGICGALVGVFPMDGNLIYHGLTAMGFFYGGMITVLIITIDLFLEKDHPYPMILKILGILSAVFFFIFNFVLGEYASIFAVGAEPVDLANLSMEAVRPSGLWLMALFEWLCLLAMLVWIFATSLHMQKFAHSKKN